MTSNALKIYWLRTQTFLTSKWKHAAVFALGSLLSAATWFLWAQYITGKTTKQMIFDIMFKYEQTKYRNTMNYTFSFAEPPKVRSSTECMAYDAIMREARQKNIADTSTKPKVLKALISIRKAMKGWASMISYSSFISTKKVLINSNINNHELTGYLLKYPGCSFENGIVIYLHGGGFFSGDVRDGYPMLNIMQQYLGCYAFVIEYGLCPEISLTNIINEGIEGYKYVLNILNVDHEKVFIVGDSSGGAFCLLLLQKIKQFNLAPQPCAGILLSPIVDLTWKIGLNVEKVGKQNGRSYTFDAQKLKDLYFGILGVDEQDIKEYNNDMDQILNLGKYSPINGVFKGLCSLYVNASMKEILFDDAKAVINKCKEFDVDVTYEWDQCLPHSTALRCDMIPECRDRLIIIIQWMKSQLTKTTNIVS